MSARKNFAERLIQLRKEGGLSRQQVADDLQISRASLEYYEKEKRAPDIETLYKIADYFHTSADYLLGRTPNKTTNPTLQAVCEYTGLSEKAIKTLNAIKACADGDDIDPKEKEQVNERSQAAEIYETKLDGLRKNFRTNNLFENYLQLENDGDFDQADAFDARCRREDKYYNEARSCWDILETLYYGISCLKGISIEKNKAALKALSVLISSQGNDAFFNNLSLFMFTDFKEQRNKQISVKTSSKEYPDDYSLYEFSNQLLDEAILSEVLNYIRGLKSNNLNSTFCSVETINLNIDEGDEENG